MIKMFVNNRCFLTYPVTYIHFALVFMQGFTAETKALKCKILLARPAKFQPLGQMKTSLSLTVQICNQIKHNLKLLLLFFSDRLSVQECLNHPWLNTEELFQRSPVRKSRRSYGSEQSKKRKKIRKTQQQNGIADGEHFAKLLKSSSFLLY